MPGVQGYSQRIHSLMGNTDRTKIYVVSTILAVIKSPLGT